jgi:hypothetical protein
MLHAVDEQFVADPGTLRLNAVPGGREIEALLSHFLDRERAVGLRQMASGEIAESRRSVTKPA